MGLRDLTDAELGHIVRDSPLWQILLQMEKEREMANLTRSTKKVYDV